MAGADGIAGAKFARMPGGRSLHFWQLSHAATGVAARHGHAYVDVASTLSFICIRFENAPDENRLETLTLVMLWLVSFRRDGVFH